jgi:hypothetical protein
MPKWVAISLVIVIIACRVGIPWLVRFFRELADDILP